MTLFYAAHDPDVNHAVVLRPVLRADYIARAKIGIWRERVTFRSGAEPAALSLEPDNRREVGTAQQ